MLTGVFLVYFFCYNKKDYFEKKKKNNNNFLIKFMPVFEGDPDARILC